MKTLLVEAQLTKVSRVKDGSVNLTFHTASEIATADYMLMDEYWQNNGWVAFKMNEVEASDIPTGDATLKGQKSDSQYLRSCLFAKHMAMGGTKETFPAYYHKAMQGFADAVNNSYER
jgi:hypothetical protein